MLESDIVMPNLSFIPPPSSCPENASIYLMPALSTLSKAVTKGNIRKVHICTPSFQLFVTSTESFDAVLSVVVLVFDSVALLQRVKRTIVRHKNREDEIGFFHTASLFLMIENEALKLGNILVKDRGRRNKEQERNTRNKSLTSCAYSLTTHNSQLTTHNSLFTVDHSRFAATFATCINCFYYFC